MTNKTKSQDVGHEPVSHALGATDCALESALHVQYESLT